MTLPFFHVTPRGGTGAMVRISVLALMVLVTGTAACSSEVQEPEAALRVMTFNIRWASPGDGANVWENRSDWVGAIIDSSNAHVVGLQEVLKHQLEDIMRDQTRYDWVGVGRDDGLESGEYSPILYDTTRFELLSWDTRWLSAQPDSIGSVGWDAALPRIATRITVRDRLSGETLRFLNTHFDHRGQEARLESARLMAAWMASADVALGDFNVEPESEPYQAMIASGLVDAGMSPSDPSDEAGTFRTFDPDSDTSVRIDYVFHAPAWKTDAYRVLAPVRDGAYPSDHLPVVAVLSRVDS